MAKAELGTKRVCPETGRKFYDLNRDPVVSPYTGKSYPLSYFEDTESTKVVEEEETDEVAEVDSDNTEVVSLEEADEEASGGSDNLPDIDDDGDVELDDDDDDTFLESDDEEEDDMSGIIGGRPEDEEES